MATLEKINPWRTAWKQPRKTVQYLVETDPTYYVLTLAGLAGFGSALDKASIKGLGDAVGAPQIVLLSLLGGFVSGIITLYVLSFPLKLASNLLEGTASRQNLRTAYAWGSLPLVAALLIWIPQLAFFGKYAFSSSNVAADSHPSAYWLLTFLELTAAVWALVLMSKMVGQVNGFSAWRGLSAIVIAALLIGACLLLVVVPFALWTG